MINNNQEDVNITKPIVFDNIVFALQKAGGISVVWQKILDGALKSTKFERTFLEYPNVNIFREGINIPENEIIQDTLGFLNCKRYINPTCRNVKKDFIFHSSYYRTCNHPLAKNVTTVHDFTYDYFSHGIRKFVHCYQRNRAIVNSDAIVCISKNTKRDLLNFLPEVDPQKINVIYNGVSEEYKPLDHKNQHYNRHIMFLGARGGYKNFRFAVEAIKHTSLNLLICGNELSNDETLFLNKVLGQKRYEMKVRPTNQELNELYNSVFCLLYPSSYEGFGIPVLEAQRAGCPVIALNASSIPEIIGNNGLLMNTLTFSDFNNKISILEDLKNREEMIEAGLENARQYSWDKMSQEYLDLYDSLLS